MLTLTLEPTKWVDVIESCPECLFSLESANNVENVLSKASTRRHQKVLLKAVEPFMVKMIGDPIGISILTSLVKYGTVATVNSVTGLVLSSCDKVLTCQEKPVETCETPLGILFERIIYREDCTGEHRINLINTLKALECSSLMGNSVLLLAAARMIIFDREFALSICSDAEAQDAFLKLSSTASKKGMVIRFCEFVLSNRESRDEKLLEPCSDFIFSALSDQYAIYSSVRPWKQITLLLASYGSVDVVRNMIKLLTAWPDISSRAKTEDYAKIVSFLLTRGPEVDDGILLVKAIFKEKKDFDEIFLSRKAFHLQLLSAVAEKEVYVATLSTTLGEPLEKKIIGAAMRYRSITKPKALATKEVLLKRLKNIRSTTEGDDNTDKAIKRRRN